MDLTFVDLLWIVPLFVLMLSLLVFVHELGHFATALLFNIRVEEFAIGFPPRAFAVNYKGIDYAINWLPLGGYVKIVGENGDSDDPRSFGKAAAWKRIIVLAAGSFMNLLLAIIIFTGLSVIGEQQPDAPLTGVASVTQGSPADLGHIQPGDNIIKVAGQSVTTVEALRSLSDQHRGIPTDFVVNRNGQEITLKITPSKGDAVPLGVGLAYWVSPAKLENVQAGSAAAKAGLKPGDEIIQINNQTVNNVPSVSHMLATTGTVQVVVNRAGQKVGPLEVTVPDGNKLPGFIFALPQHTVYYNPVDALGRALSSTWDVITALPRGIRDALAGKSQGPGVTGPLGIAQLYAEVAQQAGFSGVLKLTALLGISLFMINLLPLPALDGGRLLFILIELIRGGRRIAPEKEGIAHLAGMVVLLTFILIISFFDAQRLFQHVSLMPR